MIQFWWFLTELLPLNYFLQILFFPEGTDFTANTKARSDKFAAKNSLEPYEYVLHPRTAGFSFLVEKMRESMGIFLFIKHRLLQSLFVKLLKYFEWLKITLWCCGESTYSRLNKVYFSSSSYLSRLNPWCLHWIPRKHSSERERHFRGQVSSTSSLPRTGSQCLGVTAGQGRGGEMVPGMLGEKGKAATGILHGVQGVQSKTDPNLRQERAGGGTSVQVRLLVLDGVPDLCCGVPDIRPNSTMVFFVLNYHLRVN